MQAERFTFPRHKRLLKPAEYQQVFTQQQKIYYQGIVIYYRENQTGNPRLGIVVSKRNFKKAVTRNRLKRSIRESFRLHQHLLNSNDIVVAGTKQLTEETLWRAPAILAEIWQRLVHRSSST